MSDFADEILDDLFHNAAFAAFVEQASLQQGWPSLIATRERAYRLYETALATKNGRPARLPTIHPGADDCRP